MSEDSWWLGWLVILVIIKYAWQKATWRQQNINAWWGQLIACLWSVASDSKNCFTNLQFTGIRLFEGIRPKPPCWDIPTIIYRSFQTHSFPVLFLYIYIYIYIYIYVCALCHYIIATNSNQDFAVTFASVFIFATQWNAPTCFGRQWDFPQAPDLKSFLGSDRSDALPAHGTHIGRMAHMDSHGFLPVKTALDEEFWDPFKGDPTCWNASKIPIGRGERLRQFEVDIDGGGRKHLGPAWNNTWSWAL